MKTFVHRFSPKLSCTYEVPDSGWGQKIIRAKPYIVWHGEPKPGELVRVRLMDQRGK
jgi:hypothetical protein